MAVRRTCDLCGAPRDTARYTMSHKARLGKTANPEQVSSISAGGVDLCFACWTRTAAKRRGPHAPRNITRCDRCREHNDPLRYTLHVSVRREDGRVVSRGAGGVVLCRLCWVTIGKPKMRKSGQRNILRYLNVPT